LLGIGLGHVSTIELRVHTAGLAWADVEGLTGEPVLLAPLKALRHVTEQNRWGRPAVRGMKICPPAGR
jgi:hypothetical protein